MDTRKIILRVLGIGFIICVLAIIIIPWLAFAQNVPVDIRSFDTRDLCDNGIAEILRPETESGRALPFEWRGAFVSFDAANKFGNHFVKMEFGASANVVIGYKQYDLRFETIAPLSSQGWSYRLRLEYQIF